MLDISMLDISTVGTVPVPKWWASETSRRELSEDLSFGIGTLLPVEQPSLETRPRGCDTVVYGRINNCKMRRATTGDRGST